ncbi:unnamed protein product [Orchesella dallaii]|uniref:Uncharacterized protein n=1 Tax=Orchesella dallaii TaxID=48710 RepID=A0ABP1S9E3_9HEXA
MLLTCKSKGNMPDKMKVGASCNAVYLLQVKDGLDLPEALDKVVIEINRVNETGEILLYLYNGDLELAKFINATKGV